MLHGGIQVRDSLACHILSKSCMARICVSNKLAVYE
jgi:hypothetical protein